MSTAAARVSIEEYLAYQAPPGFRDELIEGEIVLSPDPKPSHSKICKNLVTKLDSLVNRQLFEVCLATNMVLERDDSMPSPDVFIIDRERWLSAIREDEYPRGSPQLPIEVHSPSNRPGLLRKIELYLRNGSKAVWVVYPKRRVVVVHDQADLIVEYRDGEEVPFPTEISDRTVKVSDLFEL